MTRMVGGRLIGLVLLLVTFVAGALVGAAANRVLEARPAASAAPDASGSCARGERDIFQQLDLTPAQQERVDEVLARRRAQADAFWKESGPRLQALTDSTRMEIRQVLTTEQREEYDRLREERRARRVEDKKLR